MEVQLLSFQTAEIRHEFVDGDYTVAVGIINKTSFIQSGSQFLTWYIPIVIFDICTRWEVPVQLQQIMMLYFGACVYMCVRSIVEG